MPHVVGLKSSKLSAFDTLGFPPKSEKCNQSPPKTNARFTSVSNHIFPAKFPPKQMAMLDESFPAQPNHEKSQVWRGKIILRPKL